MKKVMIKSIELKNFCGFASAKIEFNGQETEIIGATGEGKSSFYEAHKFVWSLPTVDYRPHTDDKQYIPKLETEVTEIVECDGVEHTLQRKGKQIWSLDRASGQEKYNGYEASNYSFDGVACNATQYIAKIAKVFDLEKSKLPYVMIAEYFNRTLSAKERRAKFFELLSLSELTTQLRKDEKYEVIADELAKYTETDDISSLFATQTTALNRAKVETETAIKVRTDDIAKYSDIDFSKIKEEIAETEKTLSMLKSDNKYEAATAIATEYQNEIAKKYSEIAGLRAQDSARQRKHDEELFVARAKMNRLKCNLDMAKKDVEQTFADIESYEIELCTAISLEMQPETRVCPVCHREYDGETLENVEATFNAQREAMIAEAEKKIAKAKESLPTLHKRVEECDMQYAVAVEEYDKCENAELPSCASIIADKQHEIDELNKQLDELCNQMAPNDTATKIQEYETRLVDLRDKVACEKIVANANLELVKLNQRLLSLANEEGSLIRKKKCLNTYIIDEIAIIDDTINQYFNGAKFRLFATQTANANNQYVKDCTLEYNGVDYNSLSTGQKIQADLITVEGLQKILGINAPIWKDENQSDTLDFVTDRQLIKLTTVRGVALPYSKINVAYASIIENMNK